MAAADTKVPLSTNVLEAALNINAKAAEISQTMAAVWQLEPTSTIPPLPAEAFSLNMKNPEAETVVSPVDGRTLVAEADFAPGGKYRSIVKLFMHYEFQKKNTWAMGTGWLVAPDIMVTAGHCSYDWSHQLGRATEVKAYIGYKGHQSEHEPTVQFRHVKKIVATGGWVTSKGQKAYDASFMQLDRPFTDVTPLRFENTPAVGDMEIGVVGYPGDLYDQNTKENGARMYEMFRRASIHCNSGSPVLKRTDLASIGAHCYGGAVNSASVIGDYGNPYNDYLTAFALPVPATGLHLVNVTGSKKPVGTRGGRELVKNPSPSSTQVPLKFRSGRDPVAKTSNGYRYTKGQTGDKPFNSTYRSKSEKNANGQIVSRTRHSNDTDQENFTDILRKAASIGAPLLGKALGAGLPITLGPVGAPIASLAAFALNAAGKLAESAEASGVLPPNTRNIYEGCMERAILAEATLTTLEGMELSSDAEESIFSDMKEAVMKVLPTVRKIAPHVMGAMMEPALRIALEHLHQYNSRGGRAAESFPSTGMEAFEPIEYSSAIDQPAGSEAEQFLGYLQAATSQHAEEAALDGNLEESLIDLLKAGIRPIGKGLLGVAKHGLPILLQAFSGAGQESALEGQSAEQSRFLSTDALAHRAIVAEAALQAVMKLPPDYLEEEGFLDGITDALRTIAPIAINLAAPVLGGLQPLISSILTQASSQESAGFGAVGANGRPSLRGRRSLATLRDAAASHRLHN